MTSMTQQLHTWKLTPTELPSALWYLTSLKAEIRVRAAGPLEARELAAHELVRWQARAVPDRPVSPWLDPDLVACTELKDDRFALFDEPCVLFDEPATAIAGRPE